MTTPTPSTVPAAPEISIIIPTYREAANVRVLLPRIAEVMETYGKTYEVLIVDDDSQDGIDLAVRELSADCPVRLISRTESRDLSQAVMEGMRQAQGRMMVVMDADLSHPPDAIPQLLTALERPPTEFVIGSRYVAGGQTTTDWGTHRRVNSSVATLLCRPLTGHIMDPLAGFFAIHRSIFERARDLNPMGYKIGLELICRCRCRHVAEVPITFSERASGESKLTIEQQIRYLVHLDHLYRNYSRGRGMFIRPILWTMVTGLRLVSYLTRLLR